MSDRALTPHVDLAEAYAGAIVTGEILACKWVRLACQRHRDDLARSRRKAYPYRFEPTAAERVCRFLELLPHTKGRWAAAGERMRLQPWQCFFVCVLFGWLRKADGLRRFRKAYLEVPRKNGKSFLAAGIGLFGFAADGEHGAEVYSGATTEKQAWEVFRPARLMALRTPSFQEAFGVDVGAKNLHIDENGSRFEPVIGKPGDGASPHFAIIDEYHEHATDELFETMETGMGARLQPLILVTTTAGDNIAGPCYALHRAVQQVVEGTLANDELFGLIYTLDEGDDWTTEEALRKANPNYDVSVSGEFLQARIRDAKNDARRQAATKTKHQNIWVSSRQAWMNMEWFNRQADSTLSPEQFIGDRCWITLDLANKLDMTSKCLTFRRDLPDGPSGELRPHIYQFFRNYLPEAAAEDPTKRHYQGWAAEEKLVVTDGNILDYDRVRSDVLEDAEQYGPEAVGYDPYSATQLALELQAHGIKVLEIPQTVAQISDPMKWFEALVRDGRYHHTGDAPTTWAVSNVVAKVDAKDNVFPRKEREELKIDPALTGIMGVKLALADQVQAASIFEEYSEEEWSGKPQKTTPATMSAAPPAGDETPAPRRRPGRSIYEDFDAEEWKR